MNTRKLSVIIECQECEGTGIQEVGPICYKPASMCCGGCYQEVDCYLCNGNGSVITDDRDEESCRIAQILITLHHTQKHPEWMKKLEQKLFDIVKLNKEYEL
jgi:hypothetical protein